LHGHPLDRGLVHAATAEALGTFILVLAIIDVAIAASVSRSVAGLPYSSETVAVAGGSR
jgi:hypothetical protein